MNITEPQRADLETCLDRLSLLARDHPDFRYSDLWLYESAVSVVREQRSGARKLRSDFNRPRNRTAPLPAIPDVGSAPVNKP